MAANAELDEASLATARPGRLARSRTGRSGIAAAREHPGRAAGTTEGAVAVLEGLGLDEEAERIYRQLLDTPHWGLEEIAVALDRPADRIRELLDVLADLQLVTPRGFGPGQLRPVDPEIGLSALLARSEAGLAERQRRLDESRAAAQVLAGTYAKREEFAEEVVLRYHSLDDVRRRIGQLAREAGSECLSFCPGGAQTADTLAASRPLDQQALERGVRVRTVYQDSYRNDQATTEYVRWLAALGAENRTVAVLPFVMVIVDRRSALVPLDPADPRKGAVEMRTPGAVSAMCTLFETIWSQAVNWQSPPQRSVQGLSAAERQLLALLGEGCTDELAARRLGVSERTVRRMAAELMDRLDARSRFQAGVRAARRDWVSG